MPATNVCAYEGCGHSSRKSLHLNFHRFPADKHARKEWIQNSGNERLKSLADEKIGHLRLCSGHFAQTDFVNTEGNNRRLKGNAVPLKFILSDNSESQCIVSERTENRVLPTVPLPISPQNDCHNSNVDSNPGRPYSERLLQARVESLQKHIKILQQTIRRSKTKKKLSKEDVIEGAEQFLNKSQMLLLRMQLNHDTVRKWTLEEKQFGLSLYYTSPKAYVFLRSTKDLALPCVSLIRDWINELNLTPGLCTDLLERVKAKTDSMTRDERQCVLMWDEMSIKAMLEYNSKFDLIEGFQDLGELGRTNQVAKYALVFMLRGLTFSWKQPIAYFLAHGNVPGNDLTRLTEEVLSACSKVGLCVRSMVCDQGSGNRKAVATWGITEDHPYLEFEGRKIFFNFDVPHLIKSVRNNLLTKDFKIDKDIVSWKAIKELREVERSKSCKAAPKLTDRHIAPNNFQRMNVRLATQVFSATVSAAMLAGQITGDLQNLYCVAIANFVKRINDMFDCLNSRYANDPNPLKRALSDKQPQVEQFLRDSLDWMNKWRIMIGSAPPCFAGLRLSINGILMLWIVLRKEGTLYLLTTRLNQDPLENTFAVIRSRSGHNDNPSAMKFRQNLQYSITAILLKPASGTNCEEDDGVALLSLAPNPCAKSVEIKEFNPESVLDSISESNYDDVELIGTQNVLADSGETSDIVCTVNDREKEPHIPGSNLEECAIRYVAGYLLHKCFAKFNCSACKSALTKENQNFESTNELLLFWKTYKTSDREELGHLKVPSEPFHQLIVVAYARFTAEFSRHSHERDIGRYLENCIRDSITETDSAFWVVDGECSRHREYIIGHFIKTNVFNHLKWRSRDLRDSVIAKRKSSAGEAKPLRKLLKALLVALYTAQRHL